MGFREEIVTALRSVPAPADESGAARKNYTERASRVITDAVASRIRSSGLTGTRAPERGRDKQFMGGYGTKGVDAYLSDEKHGLLLSSGTKGLLFDVRKNLKNRYRDMVMEALELHKRFPFAVCGHLFFLGLGSSSEPSRAFGTVLGEAVTLLSGITGRRRPEEAAEMYEVMGIVLFDPADPDSVVTVPKNVPSELQGEDYCERLVTSFKHRNPFYFGHDEG
ncbi:MAG: hypothetical protein HY898_29870 [Deltaproteobacteria bacterium]|nr:hypothetical protein [Deltaproteobacteria bacterium]